MDTIYINGKPDSCLIEQAPFYRHITSKRALKSLSKNDVVLKNDAHHCTISFTVHTFVYSFRSMTGRICIHVLRAQQYSFGAIDAIPQVGTRGTRRRVFSYLCNSRHPSLALEAVPTCVSHPYIYRISINFPLLLTRH